MVKIAIISKYLNPTNARGARVKATSELGSVTIPYDHASSIEGAHLQAAQALCRKLKRSGTLLQGSLKSGFAFVFADSRMD